jgi:DNA polymerase-3 subunit delta
LIVILIAPTLMIGVSNVQDHGFGILSLGFVIYLSFGLWRLFLLLMPIVAYNDFSAYLNRSSSDGWPAVTLVCGEEMLCKKAFDAILDRLVPEKERTTGVERFDGTTDSLGEVLSSLNTFALLSRAKVVVLHDARLFYSAKAAQELRQKMALAAQAGEMKKAARPFLNLLALIGLTFDDLTAASSRKKVADDIDGEPAPWLEQLVDYCRRKGMRIPETRDDADVLARAMQQGFPDGHRLLITTEYVDRRKALFKAIDTTGLVVDCTIPKGERRADRVVQEAAMQAVIDEALVQAGKTMAANARRRLMQLTGFDLRTLAGNLEKLFSYAGRRDAITDTDVTVVLRRSRKDPIFDFTNAVAERDLQSSLFLMRSLLDEGMHPLQLLTAVANQLRRLLMARDFIDRDQGRSWSPGLAFPRFKTATFKAVRADDDDYTTLRQTWESMLAPPRSGKQPKPVAGDLLLAKNPKSPFPVFQTLKKADPFSMAALRSAMIALSETDRRMKSTGQDPRTLLEDFLIRLCGSSGGSEAKGGC